MSVCHTARELYIFSKLIWNTSERKTKRVGLDLDHGDDESDEEENNTKKKRTSITN